MQSVSFADSIRGFVNSIANAYDDKLEEYKADPRKFASETLGDMHVTFTPENLPGIIQLAIPMMISSIMPRLLPEGFKYQIFQEDKSFRSIVDSGNVVHPDINDFPPAFPRHQLLAKLDEVEKELNSGWKEVPGYAGCIARNASIAEPIAVTRGTGGTSLVKQFPEENGTMPLPVLALLGIAKKAFPDQEEHMGSHDGTGGGCLFFENAGFARKDGVWTVAFTHGSAASVIEVPNPSANNVLGMFRLETTASPARAGANK